MRPQEFYQKHIKQGDMPLYCLFKGFEDYWKDRHFKSIVKDGDSSLNIFNFNAKNDPVSKIIEESNNLGFFGSKQIIIFKEVGALNKEAQKELIKYLENPNPETLLILDCEKLDGRSALASFKPLKNWTIDFEIKSDHDVVLFIKEKLHEIGDITLSPKLEKQLLACFPKDLRRLSQNIEKLAAHANYKSPINIESFNIVNSLELDFEPFALCKAVLDKNFTLAMKIHKQNQKAKENLFGNIGMLRWQFDQALRAKELVNQNIGNSEISKTCRIPSFKIKEFLNQIQKVTLNELAKKFSMIADCDFKLKSSGTSPDHLFENLLYRLCR